MYTEVHTYSSNAFDPNNPSFPIRSAPYVDRFKILRCSIPLAYESTDSSNNVVVFSRGGFTKHATIPSASHNSATFPSALQDALNAVADTKDFVVTYDQNTRRLTLSAGSSFTIHNFSGGTTAYSQLGMNKYEPAKSGSSITFGVADFTNYAPLILTSSTLVSKSVVYASEEAINVLALIEPNAPQNSVVSWNNLNGGWLPCGSTLSRLDFRLLNGRTMLPVALSQPYSVSIGFLTDPDDPIQ